MIKPASASLPPWPPWRVRFDTRDADIAAMYAAVNARLDALDLMSEMLTLEWEEEVDYRGPPPPSPEQRRQQRRQFALEWAKSAAAGGNMDPLRRLYPEIAESINPPPRHRGEGRHQVDWRRWNLECNQLRPAIDDVYRIRQLWQRHYGKWKRPDSDDIQAEAIAGKRHGLTERQVREAMKRGLPGLYGPHYYKLPTDLPI